MLIPNWRTRAADQDSQLAILRLGRSQKQRTYLLHMDMIGSAATAENIHVGKGRLDVAILSGQFIRIAFFEVAKLAECAVCEG